MNCRDEWLNLQLKIFEGQKQTTFLLYRNKRIGKVVYAY